MMGREIKNVPLMLAIVTASLFVFGLTFHQGYLKYWGLEETVFGTSFERTLYHGFLAANYLSAKVIGSLVAFFLVFALVAVAYSGFINILRSKGLYGPALKVESTDESVTADAPWYLKWAVLGLLITFWFFCALVALWALLALAGRLGAGAAADQYSTFRNTPGAAIQLQVVSGERFAAHVIGCSTTHCAYLVGSEVKFYPLSSVALMESKPGRKQGSDKAD